MFRPVEISWEGDDNVLTCRREEADWVHNVVTPNVYYGVYFWFRVIFVNLGPCASLVVLNVLLFAALRRAQQKRDKLFKENRKASECRKLRDSNCTTVRPSSNSAGFLFFRSLRMTRPKFLFPLDGRTEFGCFLVCCLKFWF